MGKADLSPAYRNNRTICLPISQEEYGAIVSDPKKFRKWLDALITLFFGLLAAQIVNGYRMKDFYFSEKLSILIRRIEIAGVAFDDVEKALFLRTFGVPFWALSHVFGRDQMYWYRMEQALGRNSIVGTTIRNPDNP